MLGVSRSRAQVSRSAGPRRGRWGAKSLSDGVSFFIRGVSRGGMRKHGSVYSIIPGVSHCQPDMFRMDVRRPFEVCCFQELTEWMCLLFRSEYLRV